MSKLSEAVDVAREHPDLDLSFDNCTGMFWYYDGDCITYSDLLIDILEDTGNAFCIEVRYEVDHDDYIRYHVDNGCGDKYDAVFEKAKLVEVE